MVFCWGRSRGLLDVNVCDLEDGTDPIGMVVCCGDVSNISDAGAGVGAGDVGAYGC